MFKQLVRLSLLIVGISSFIFLIIYYGFEDDHSHSLLHYWHFIIEICQGNFGASAITGENVLSEIKARWPATIELGILAMLMSIAIGIPLGIVAAICHQQFFDHCLVSISLISYSMPIFWLSLLLILFFSIGLDWTPVSGRINVVYDVTPMTGFMLIDTLRRPVTEVYGLQAFYSAVSHLILPAIALASMPIAMFTRVTRASLLNILSKDFIVAARAKGLSECRVIIIHALRNALSPIICSAGMIFISTVVMGSIVVEVIFAWPGIGNYIIQSVYAKDHAVVKFFLFSVAMIVLLTQSLIDRSIYLLNPRRNIT